MEVFGWAIVCCVEEDGSVSDAYPARVKYRGFNEDTNTKGYVKVSKYLKENCGQLLKEAED